MTSVTATDTPDHRLRGARGARPLQRGVLQRDGPVPRVEPAPAQAARVRRPAPDRRRARAPGWAPTCATCRRDRRSSPSNPTPTCTVGCGPPPSAAACTSTCASGSPSAPASPTTASTAVISSLVLCTVTDPAEVLAEIRRILRPGGTFRFVEHVAAPTGTPTRCAAAGAAPAVGLDLRGLLVRAGPGRFAARRRVRPRRRRAVPTAHAVRHLQPPDRRRRAGLTGEPPPHARDGRRTPCWSPRGPGAGSRSGRRSPRPSRTRRPAPR